MKTKKMIKTITTLTVTTLVVALAVGQVQAADLKIKDWNKPKTANQAGKLNPADVYGGPIVYNPKPAPAAQPAQPNQPDVHNHYYQERGFGWGEFAGGTALGLVMGTMTNQPQQATQPQVVYIQRPNGDTTPREAELELEIERERAKARALELEIERLRAERQQ